ncbi:ABC transporter ATP-binding protein, partial [Candidatus Magnetomorum sp. HK-1]
TEELVRKLRVRMMNKIRNTELVFLEQNGHSEIYVRLTQDINTVSQAIPVLIGMFIFVLPLFVESQRIIVPKLITALLYIYSPLSMIYKFAPHVVMSNIAIEKLNNLEDKLNNAAAKTVKPSTILNDFQTIELKSLLFNYTDKDNQALFQVGPLDLTINKGEIIFIAGGNGSGKSTLLKMLTGLYETISPGEIILDGSVLTKERVPDYRELFTIIFTDYHLFNKLYGLDHIDPSLITSLLEEMELDKKTQYVNHQFTNTNLSTGQKKRLAYLAARLENKPIYVFDEWAADQDPNFRQYFYTTIIKDLKRAGKTIIAVTHDDRYFHEADRLIQIKDGKIIQ